ALEQTPTAKDFKEAETALESARTKRQEDDKHYKENKAEIDKELGDKASDRYYVANKAKLDSLAGDKQRSDMRFNDTKADLESILSFYNEEMEINPDSDRAKEYKKKIVELEKKLAEAKEKKDEIYNKILVYRLANDKIEKPVTKAVADTKKVTDKFDGQVKAAILNRWGLGDSIRAWPIIDAFASPLKIQQFTIEDVPIDYNFKYVTRFDRCMTCHQGIDRGTYTRSMLASLTEITEEQDQKWQDVKETLKSRKSAFEGLPEAAHLPDAARLGDLKRIPADYLTQGRINEFAA